MATELQRQLAQISANSTHQLDVKAQKTQHAKSLLFEPSDAARQSFDDVYQICIEGFDELCQLDARFSQFANNLFGESSKEIDRGQLTQNENHELDEVIERFLGLVQGRLLLKPAQKSVEWIVRRWKAHEFNTESLLLTFLPYHTDQRILPALFAILPMDRALPESFKWLHPYIASLSCPPRHAVLSAMVSNRNLFTAFNSYALRAAKASHASSILLAFWAGLVAQAVNSMLDSSRSGRDNVRRQREEEILLKVLPVLQDALRLSRKGRYDEMFMGACMIATILATKASLSDAVLDAVMEAVAGAWSERTMNEGVTCLAVVAEEKDEISIPASVTRNLLKDDAFTSLVQQSRSQRLSKLAGGFAIGILRSASQKGDASNLHIVKAILDAEMLKESELVQVIECLTTEREKLTNGHVYTALSDIIISLLDSNRYAKLAQHSAYRLGMQDLIQSNNQPEPILVENMELDPTPAQSRSSGLDRLADLSRIVQSLPELPYELFSFFEASDASNGLFHAYSDAFQSALSFDRGMDEFINALALDQPSPMSRPAYYSLFARIWSSPNTNIATTAKTQALMSVKRSLNSLVEQEMRKGSQRTDHGGLADLQALFPYVLTALADETRTVRELAGQACRALGNVYDVLTARNIGDDRLVWGKESIYGSDASDGTSHVQWLTKEHTSILLAHVTPALEDCVLDSGHIIYHMANVLDRGLLPDPKQGKKSKETSKDAPSHICLFLAAHARVTPVLRTKLCLLRMLGEIDRTASSARSQVLSPFVKEWAAFSRQHMQEWCEREGVDVRELDAALLGNMKRRSDEQMQVLRDICSRPQREGLVEAAFQRHQQLWPTLKPLQMKIDMLTWLLDLAVGGSGGDERVNEQALETLRTLELPSDVAVQMLESLPSISNIETQPPASKRRRTSEAERPQAMNRGKLEMMIRRITLVLELIEGSKQNSIALLRPLFHLLAELRHFKTVTGSELVYLHAMLLDSLLSVVSNLQTTSQDQLSREIVRTDLLIDCVRSSASSQIHNTALLIVSTLAGLAPESVLHSVIPLFTFMSSTVLRKTDEYSAHATDQAIARIVPPLASSLKKKTSNDLLGGLSELLLSFVAAWEHVPLHRRLGLFDTVVRSVGIEASLGAVMAMLVERYADNDSSLSGFIADLTNRFEPVQSLKAAKLWLQLVLNGLQPRPKSTHKSVFLSDVLLGLSDKDKEEQDQSIQIMLTGLATLLETDLLRDRLRVYLVAAGETEANHIRSTYAPLTEMVIELTQRPETANSTLRSASGGLLSAVLGLLPTPDFITSCAQLMQSGSGPVREQVFRSLESRVHSSSPSNAAERRTFLDVLPSCTVFIKVEQPVTVRIAAIECIDAICEKFGKSDRLSVRNVAQEVAGPAALGASDHRLRTLSILCLASITEVLGDGDESISILPGAVRQTIGYFKGTIDDQGKTKDDVEALSGLNGFQDAAFRLLTAVLDNVPWILASAPKQLDKALAIAADADVANIESVHDFMSVVEKKVPALELFHSLERIWSVRIENLNVAGSQSTSVPLRLTRNLIGLLHRAVQYHSKATITKHASILFNLLLKALDLRHQISSNEGNSNKSTNSDVFDQVDQLAVDTTLKMNDVTFRPFFARLVNWATTHVNAKDKDTRKERMKSVYSFALLLFEKLKSIVTSYMSFLLNSVGEILQASHETTVDDELRQLVVDALASSFRSDESDFWKAPSHFDVVANPLIDLLRVREGQVGDSSTGLVGAITDLAAAITGSTEQLKSMNSRLLLLLRHDSADVRLATVGCQRAITKRVNIDWLDLLPELLPAISELQEDDDERVERHTLLWVKEIEEISGESLEAMLA